MSSTGQSLYRSDPGYGKFKVPSSCSTDYSVHTGLIQHKKTSALMVDFSEVPIVTIALSPTPQIRFIRFQHLDETMVTYGISSGGTQFDTWINSTAIWAYSCFTKQYCKMKPVPRAFYELIDSLCSYYTDSKSIEVYLNKIKLQISKLTVSYRA